MNLPKKHGEIYVKYDENNNPEYGFIVEEGKYIKKFLKMSDKKFDVIVLPNLVEKSVMPSDYKVDMEKLAKNKPLWFGKYASGEVVICSDCFNNIDDATIIVPFDASLKVFASSFKSSAKISFATLNKNLELKAVSRQINTYFDYEYEHYVLIAHKDIEFRGKVEMRGDINGYFITGKKEVLKSNYPNFTFKDCNKTEEKNEENEEKTF